MAIHQAQVEKAVALVKAYGATRLILFGSALEAPAQARDLDMACDGVPGWKLYELGARLEEELQVPLDLVPLSPPTHFTRLIEAGGKYCMKPEELHEKDAETRGQGDKRMRLPAFFGRRLEFPFAQVNE